MWGRGYATEALQAYVAHAFKTLALGKLTSAAMPANTGSIRVQEKAGFRKSAKRDPAGAGARRRHVCRAPRTRSRDLGTDAGRRFGAAADARWSPRWR